MKLAFLIILITCMQVSATGYSQDAMLTLNMKQVPIARVLKVIEQKTDYKFVYSSNFFPAGLLVDVEAKNKAVSEILTRMLAGTDFTFRKIDNDLIVFTSKQEPKLVKEVKGKVIASATGEVLAGVTVTVDKTGQSTATDGRGEFSIKVP
ncbi:STN and carboxypeptidase regulatory-like domain-containing protein, partial [Flavitalea flava]